jgi:predicted AlkP superfamily phosphohydrolase/phosphomutase
MKKIINITSLIIILTIGLQAYVGPGAGFAFLGSFFFIFIAFIVAIFNFLTFPIRAFFRFFKRYKALKNARVKRIVILGFDGMDYRLTNKLIEKGKLPNFKKLKETGTFAPLKSTEPPISPVAWSTFATGVNPGKHNIFDFLTRDPLTYYPALASTSIIPPKKFINMGNIRIPISKPKIELLRKSKAFWKITGEHGIFSSVLRVPITFPPEKFYGNMTSGLGTPDLRGTQGSFTYISETEDGCDYSISDGVSIVLSKNGNGFIGKIPGPENPFRRDGKLIESEFYLKKIDENSVEIETAGKKIILKKGKLSDWTKLEFKAGVTKVTGIARWFLISAEPHIQLYLSPINIDPDKPAMDVSSPKIFSVYLSKIFGPFATLGMVEDTWALNEGLLTEEGYLEQVYTAQREREKIYWDTFSKIKEGLVVSVFEATDRVQHMFFRYLDKESPAPKNSDKPEIRDAITIVYEEMDKIVGETLEKLGKDDVLMIVSDHGFDVFNRGFNVNTWLYKEGYLALKEGKTESGKWFADVDWSKTKAYGTGLGGIFLNIKGREKQGIVDKGEEAEKIKREIKEKLQGLTDKEKNRVAIDKVFLREEIYKGGYVKNAPDIIIGYAIGTRISWESAVGEVGGDIFVDNKRLWSGDHCFTSAVVPGIFFSNRKIKYKDPTLADISPSILSLFGIKIPSFIDGRDLEVN